jgi:signal peptidase I
MDATATSKPSWIQILVIGRNPKRTLLRAIITAAVVLLVSRFILIPIRVEGISMLPTYHERQLNFVNRLAYLFHEPRHGDVVSIRTTGKSIMYMKRVVGVPGETIAFINGQLLINGEVVPEPYLKLPSSWDVAPRTLGPTEYYLVGDNRTMPPELHTKGAVERRRILGKVLL